MRGRCHRAPPQPLQAPPAPSPPPEPHSPQSGANEPDQPSPAQSINSGPNALIKLIGGQGRRLAGARALAHTHAAGYFSFESSGWFARTRACVRPNAAAASGKIKARPQDQRTKGARSRCLLCRHQGPHTSKLDQRAGVAVRLVFHVGVRVTRFDPIRLCRPFLLLLPWFSSLFLLSALMSFLPLFAALLFLFGHAGCFASLACSRRCVIDPPQRKEMNVPPQS